jgi:hypothetical protein
VSGCVEHDPEKHVPDLIRDGYRFSDKIMLHEKSAVVNLRTTCRDQPKAVA